MSRLLSPGLGNYLDRWTILDLKIKDYERRHHRHPAHFLAEQEAIFVHLRTRYGSAAVLDTAPARSLLAINSRIWDLLDIQAAGAKLWPKVTEQELAQLAETAVLSYRLNDERAQIVDALNGTAVTEMEKTR